MKKFFTLFLLLGTLPLWAKPFHFFAAPTTAPKNFTVSSSDGDRLHLSWTNGNGVNRIVIARKEAAVTFTPSNGVSYSAAATFGSGNEVATGEFVVYNGNNNSTTVTNLQPNTQYYFSIFEFNGTGASIEYLTTVTTTNGFTLAPPTSQVTNFAASNVIGNSLKLSWTAPPTAIAGSGRIVIGREGAPVNVNPLDLVNYTASQTFGNGSEIGSGNFVLAKTNANNITVESLKPSTQYHFAVFEYKGNSGLVFNITSPPTISVTTLPRPTVNASGPAFSFVEGNSMKIVFTKGNGARRIVVARAGAPVSTLPVDGATYTANAVFGTAGTELATGEYVLANGTIDNVSITGLSKATTYHFAIFEYDGTGSATAYLTASALTASQSTVVAPTIQAAGINISTVLNNAVTFSWGNGNGSRRMVIMRKDAAVNVSPVDLTSYGVSPIFGNGSHMGAGNYVVFNNTGNTATVAGLSAGATYHFTVYEYNGSSSPVYLTSNPPVAQFTTGQSPTQGAGGFDVTNIEGNRLTFNWSNGNGNKRIVVIKAGGAITGTPVNGTNYTAQAAFGAGDQLGGGEYVVMNSASSQVTVTNLLPATSYHIAVFEYNVVNNVSYYLMAPGRVSGTTFAAPTTNSSSLQCTAITGNSMKLTWAKGTGSRRIVLAKAGSPVDALPVNFSNYNDNSSFGAGVQIGSGNYVVYAGTGNTVTLTNLGPGITYHFAVFEYNGISYPVYLTAGELRGSQQTAERPSVAASGFVFQAVEGNKMTVKWTSGNGSKRILIGRAGSPVTALPEDGIDYTSNAAFGSGQEILPGQFVAGDGNISEVNLTNLQPSTTYHFAVFEYDGAGANTRYLTNAFGSGSRPTLSAPVTGPANVLFSSVGTTTASVNWTNAVADKHLVVIRKGAPVTALPQQLTLYSSSTNYAHNGTMMAPEHYVLYSSGSGSNTNVTGLQPGTTYHIAVFAYNGTVGPMYNTTDIAAGNFTTLGPPTDGATNLQAVSAGNGTSVNIRWNNGSGQRRLVVMRAANAVNATPSDNTNYTANNFFGSGHHFGSGNYAVYAGTGDNVTVNNLQNSQVYYVAVYEYNQFSTGPVYLTTSFAQGQFSGVILPVKLGNFSGVAGENANLLQWTTLQEINAAEFIIERSANGSSFVTIGTVAARGNSTTSQLYKFEDRARNAVGFYRLRMVDVNGKSEYSAVLRLQTTKEEGLKLFPTLATSSVQVSLTVAERTVATIRIVDMNGRVVVQQNKSLEAGVVTTTVDVSRLVSGSYLLQVQIGQNSLTERFLKQ